MTTVIFKDDSDLTIRFVLTLLLFGQIFYGYFITDIIKENMKWFNIIEKHVKGHPTYWMISTFRTFIYFILAISLFIFYRNSSDLTTSTLFTSDQHFVFTTISFIILFNIAFDKLWFYSIYQWRRLVIALLLITIVTTTSIIILMIFGLNDKWIEFGTFFPYFLWNLYMFYITLYFIIVYDDKINK